MSDARTTAAEGGDEGARAFGIDELFFSTTDRGGRILAGNPVFARVSAFEMDELRGRPHNIIRHPDMPRVVFRLLWRYLEKGRPVAAYVKNRAKDGRYYWVVATVVPIEDGYLSVRFKPSSPHFETVRGLYRRLLEVEREVEGAGRENDGGRKAAMDASERVLEEALAGLGLPDYDAFMHLVLPDEIASRERLLADDPAWSALWGPIPEATADGGLADELLGALHGFRAVHSRMDRLVADVETYGVLRSRLSDRRATDLAEEIRLQSLNMRIAAARREAGGEAIGVVAQIMGHEAQAAHRLTGALNDRGGRLDRMLADMAFCITIGRLQAELAVFVVDEMRRSGRPSGWTDAETVGCVAVLGTTVAAGLRGMAEAAANLERELEAVRAEIDALGGLVKMLAALQTNGRIEAAHLTDTGTISHLLADFQERVDVVRGQTSELESAVDAARLRAAGTSQGRVAPPVLDALIARVARGESDPAGMVAGGA